MRVGDIYYWNTDQDRLANVRRDPSHFAPHRFDDEDDLEEDEG